jgi:hypothetical protein
MIVSIAEAVKRSPQHPFRLVKAPPPRDQALLDLGDCQVRTILRITTLRPISKTKTPLAADLASTCEYHAGAPAAARADHPHATPAKMHGRGCNPNLGSHVETVASGQFHFEHSASASCSYQAHLCLAVCQVEAR